MEQSIIFVHPNAGARALFHVTALGKGFHVQTLESYPEALEMIRIAPPELFVVGQEAGVMPSHGYFVQIKQTAAAMKVLSLPRGADIRESIESFFDKLSGGERILIVDDEPDCIDIIKRYLTRRGYTVATAMSGEEALKKVAAEKPALVLLDIHMPGMDGLTALKKIREIAPTIIVIMTTALDRESVVREAVALGATAYLVKPFSLEKLEESVLEQLKKDHLHPLRQTRYGQ